MITCNNVVGKTGFYLYIAIVLLRPARPNKVMWVKEIQSICRMFLKCYVKFVECQHYDTFFADTCKFLINYIYMK